MAVHYKPGSGSYNNSTVTNEYQQADYTENLQEDEAEALLSNPEFLEDIYSYYGERDGKSFSGQQEAVEYFLSDRRWRNLNTVSIGKDVYDAKTQSDAQSRRLARIQKAYDAMPNFVGDKGQAALSIAGALAFDPLNLIGFGAGGAAARTAVTAAKLSGNLTRGFMGTGMRAGMKAGAIGEGVAGGVVEGIADIGMQNRNIEIGLQDEFSYGRLAGAVGLGTATGGIIGGGLGAGAAVGKFRNLGVKGFRPFDDSRIVGDKGGVIGNRPGGMQATREDMMGENLEAIAEEMGISVDAASELTKSSVGRGEIDAAIQKSKTLQQKLRPELQASVDVDGGTGSLENEIPFGEDANDNQLFDDLIAVNEQDIANKLEELNGQRFPEGNSSQRVDEGGVLDTTNRNFDSDPEIQRAKKSIQKLKWLKEWRKTRRPALVKAREELLAKMSPEEAGSGTPDARISKIDDAIERGDRTHSEFTTFMRNQTQKQDPLLLEHMDDKVEKIVDDEVLNLTDDRNIMGLLENQNTRTVSGEGFTTEQQGAVQGEGFTMTDEGTVADGAAPDRSGLPDDEQVVSQGDARVEGTEAAELEKLESERVARAAEFEVLKKKLSRNKDGIEKQRAALRKKRDAETNPEIIKSLDEQIEALNVEQKEARVRFKELKQQIESEQPVSKDAGDAETYSDIKKNVDDEGFTAEDEFVLEVAAELQDFKERFLSVDEQLNNELSNFKATKGNVTELLLQLGYDKAKANEVLADMPKGNTLEARAGRVSVLRSIIDASQGKEAFNNFLRIASRNAPRGQVPAHLLDQEIVNTLITETVPEHLRVHAFQHFSEWQDSQLERIILDAQFELGEVATISELRGFIKSVYGETKLTSTIDKYIDSNFDTSMQKADPNKFDSKAYVEEQKQKFPEITERWNKFLNSQMKVFMKLNPKISEAKTRALFNRNIAAIWDKFAEKETFTRVSNHGKSYSVKGLTTRTMRDISVSNADVEANPGADYMGHSINRYGNYTQGNGKPGSGRETSNKQVGRIQRIIEQLRPGQDYFGSSTFDVVKTTNDGVKRVYTGNAAARQIQMIDMLKNNQSQAMTVDAVKRKRSIDKSNRLKNQGSPKYSEHRDVELLEQVIANITSSRNRLKKYSAELDTMMERPGDKDFDRAERLAEKAANDLSSARTRAVQILRGSGKAYQTAEQLKGTNIRPLEEFDDVEMKEELKELLSPLVKSTRQEQTANVVEERKNSPLIQIDTLLAEKKAMAPKYFRLKNRLTEGEVSSELVAMQQRYDEIAKEIERLKKILTPGMKKALDDTQFKQANQELARIKLEFKKSNVGKEGTQKLNEDEVSDAIENVVGTRPDSQSAAEIEQQILNAGLDEDQMNSMLAQIKQMKVDGLIDEEGASDAVKDVVSKSDKNPVNTSTKPSGTKNNPIPIQIGERVYDIANDITYKRLKEGKAQIIIDGKVLGTVQRGESNGKFSGTITKTIGTRVHNVSVTNKKDFNISIAEMFQKELDLVLDKKGINPEGVRSQAPMEVIDWHKTQRYEGRKDTPIDSDTNDVIDNAVDEAVEYDPTLNSVPSDFDIPEDRMLTLQLVDPNLGKKFGTTRNLWNGDVQSIGDVAGKLRPDQYIIGTSQRFNADGQVQKNSTKLTRSTFRPLDSEEKFVNLQGQFVLAKDVGVVSNIENPLGKSPRARDQRPTNVKQLDAIALTPENLSPKLEQTKIASRLRSAGDLFRYIGDMEATKWKDIKTLPKYEALVQNLEGAYETLEKLAPNGIKMNNDTRVASFQTLKKLLTGKKEADVAAILTLFNKIAGSQNRSLAPTDSVMPKFEKFSQYGYRNHSLNEHTDANSVVMRGGKAEGDELPDTVEFAHEMGHWAYSNMLSPQEKVEFWGIAKKYMSQNQGVDVQQLKKRLPGFHSNELESPAEFFANQFALYALKKNPGMTQSLFENVAYKLKQLIAKMFNVKQEAVDPDLIPLFERIMPDPPTASGTVTNGRSLNNQFNELLTKINGMTKSKTSAASLSAQELHDLREMQIMIEKALTENAMLVGDSKNNQALQNVLAEVSAKIYGKYGGQPGARTHKSGAKRVGLLDSYQKGKPNYNKEKGSITLANGKEVYPFYFQNARIARGRMLRSSNRIHRLVHDSRILMDNAELQKLIDEQNLDRQSDIIDQEIAMTEQEFGVNTVEVEQTSGALASTFEAQANVLKGQDEAVPYSQELNNVLVQEANEMLVALDTGIDEFVNVFNRNMSRGVSNVKAPNIDKAGRIFGAGNAKAKAIVQRQYNADFQDAKAMVDFIEGKHNANEIGDGAQAVDPVVHKSPHSMKDRELLEKIKELGVDNAETNPLKREYMRRKKAKPEVKPWEQMSDTEKEFSNTLAKEISKLSQVESGKQMGAVVNLLRRKLANAIEEGRYDEADLVASFLSQRTNNITKPKASLVGKAIDVEIAQNKKYESANGIPGDAPPAIKEVLSKITHRDKNIEFTSRTMLYRMLNLLGRTATEHLNDHTTFMTVKDLYSLAGVKALPEAKGAFMEVAPTNGMVFNDLRKNVRKYAIGLTKGKSDPMDVMHEIGHMMSRAIHTEADRDMMLNSFRDAVTKQDPRAMDVAAKYKQLPPEVGYKESDIAEEWFVESWAQWISGKVAKGDIFNVRHGKGVINELQGKSQLAILAEKFFDYVAYVVNGLIGRKSVRQMFRQMTYHGDMFAPSRQRLAVKNSVDEFDYPLVNLAQADTYARQVVDNMTEEKKILVREFLGIGPEEDLMRYVQYHGTPAVDVFNRSKNPDVYIRPSQTGMMGPGVYTTPEARFAEVFADPDERSAVGARENIISQMEDGANKQEAINISESMERYEELLMEKDYDLYGMDDFLMEVTGGEIFREIETIKASKRAAEKAFAQVTGYRTHSGVLPVFVRTKNVLDLSTNKIYTVNTGEPNDIVNLINSAQVNNLIMPDARERLIRNLGSDEDFDGEMLYSSLIEAVDPSNETIAKEKIAKFLQDEGYEGIHAGTPGVDGDEQFTMFSPNHIKHIDAEVYDSDRRGIYYSVFGAQDTEGIAGATLQHMVLKNKTVSIDDVVKISKGLQEAGSPEMVKPIKKIIRNEPLTSEDQQAVKQSSSVFRFFKENSQRLRMMGGHWLADFIKPEKGVGLYERHDVDLADKIMPVMNILKTLPDNDTWAKRWARKNAYLIPDIGKLGTLRDAAAQPASHRRILNAIRRGESAVQKLDAREEQAARLIIATFEQERKNLINAGMPVGDTRRGADEFYVPQQWDTEGIRQNPKGAIEAFTRFFVEERRRPDFESTGNQKAPRQVAEDLVNAMMDTSGEVYGDDVIRRAVGDPFFQRLIKLDPDQYDYMTDFLVNDLEGLMTQYFDRTTRKLAIADKLGTGGHAYATYVTVAERGLEAVKDALMNSAKRRYKMRQYQSEIDIEQLVVAKASADESRIDEAMEKIAILVAEDARGNKHAIKNVLSGLYEPRDAVELQTQKRIDAMANALADFKLQKPSAEFLRVAENMVDIVNKRPLTKFSGNELSYKISRNVKAFNAVSLLGFTTLTSMGDFVLPLIRSGNMGAFLKSQFKYMTDPSYRAAAKNIGVSIENLIHDRMVQMAGEGSQKLQNSFFNFTLLTPWTNMQREIAGIHGFEAFKAEIARARRLQQNGQTNTTAYRTSIRFLERYGMTGENALTDFVADGAPQLTDIRDTDILSNKALRYALLRFTNETIFTPNPNEIPLLGQTPWGSMMFQLKSFQLMMARMARYIISEAGKGNVKPAVYMATAGVGMGYLANTTKDFAQSRGGEDNESFARRERSIVDSNPLGLGTVAEMLGVPEGSDRDIILGNYFEGLLAIGGLGLFGELLHNTAAQADNGAYGKMRVASAIFGPAVGLGEDIFDVGIAGPQSLLDPEGKNARRREAVRSIMGRIPVAGGIRGFKEEVVDLVAGEAGTGGRKSTSSGFGGNQGGFGGGGFGKGGF